MRYLTTAICLACSLGAGVALADSIGDVRTGNAAFGDGRYDAAIEAFSRAILTGDLEPEALAITFNNRGVAYSELGDYDRAIKDYQQALTLVPKDPTAIKNLRIAYIRRAAAAARLGDQTAALADYDRAIELEPNHPLAYMRRGQLQLDRGDNAAAIADLTRAQQLDPANKDITALLEDARRAPTAAVAEPAAPAPATGGDRRPRAVAGCHTAGRRERLFDRSGRGPTAPGSWPTCARDRDGRAGGGAGSRSRSSFWPVLSRDGRREPAPGSGQRVSKDRRAGAGDHRCGGRRAARLAADPACRWRQRLGLQEVAGGRRHAVKRRARSRPVRKSTQGDKLAALFASARARFSLSDLLRLSVKICHQVTASQATCAGGGSRHGIECMRWGERLRSTLFALFVAALAAATGLSPRGSVHSPRLPDRLGPGRAQCRRRYHPRVAYQDDDALPHLQRALLRPARSVVAAQGFRPGRRHAAHQAGSASRRHDRGRGRDHGPGDALGQRCRLGPGGGAGGQRGPVRHGDDAHRPQARHDPHRVPQRFRAAGRRAAHDRA